MAGGMPSSKDLAASVAWVRDCNEGFPYCTASFHILADPGDMLLLSSRLGRLSLVVQFESMARAAMVRSVDVLMACLSTNESYQDDG